VVRVEMSRLDELMRMIGDLVISRARLESALARVERHVPPVEWRGVQENSQIIERQLRDLREGVIRVRLVPVRRSSAACRSSSATLARETDKRVRLELRGQETEIDKYLIRADDGSRPPPGAQRRQPWLRAGERAPGAREARGGHAHALGVERRRIGAARDCRRWARHRPRGGGGARARDGRASTRRDTRSA
jgi:hypothetical protein